MRSPTGQYAALLTALVVARGAWAAAEACVDGPRAAVWWSPEQPSAGEPLRIMAVTEDEREAVIAVTGLAEQRRSTLPTVRRGGPPWSFAATLAAPVAGAHRVELRGWDKALACRTIKVGPRGKPRPARVLGASVWETTRAWDHAAESFYSAWIETLFDAPASETLSFASLAPVLRDPRRNFLHGHLGLREDDPGNRAVPRAEPDCADLPYYLRAYFAWKLGLPVGFRDCDRGTAGRPPRCGPMQTNADPAEGKDPVAALASFLRHLANKVHSGSARTALADQETDHYPLKLAREHLRPGVIYADPYGHVLMIVKWEPQGAGGGRLYAVDGQPDNSVARKRFWEGTFLFASDVLSAGPGFKAFRPLARPEAGRPPAPLSNQALARHTDFPAFDLEQAGLSPEGFYARMAGLINPRGLDAAAAYEETLAALVEQLETRVGSVENGAQYVREHPGSVVPMPEGGKIFETTGPWEDYATPSRDMRLIIAIKVLTSLPERVVRHPGLFLLGGQKPEAVSAAIAALHERRVRERSITYARSDGSPFRLTVADVLARRSAFELAYNPNDCVEVRWGAAEGTPEHATCLRRAPTDQLARMAAYRAWFREARRPPR